MIVCEDCVSERIQLSSGCQYIKQPANYLSLRALPDKRDDITHVASVSVFERVDSDTRQGVVQPIHESIDVRSFVATLEYHSRTCYFEHQLAARSLSDLTTCLDSFSLDSFDASSVWCEERLRYAALRQIEHILATRAGGDSKMASLRSPIFRFPIGMTTFFTATT
jgi:hypothetical protein